MTVFKGHKPHAGTPGGPGRGPGWFSRSPVMAKLASSLRGMGGHQVFAGLRGIAQPALTFANAILARFTAREPVHPRWQGQLQLNRSVQAGRAAPQPTFRRLVERREKHGEVLRALHTLSLPEGVLDAIEPRGFPGLDEEFSKISMQAWRDEEVEAAEYAGLEIGSHESPQPAGTESPVRDAPPSYPERQAVRPEEGKSVRSALNGPSIAAIPAARRDLRATQAGPRPPQVDQQTTAWPFQLVAPRRPVQAGKDAVPPHKAGRADIATPNMRIANEGRGQWMGASSQRGDRELVRAQRPSRMSTMPAAFELQARLMTIQKMDMPVSTVRFPAATADETISPAPEPSQVTLGHLSGVELSQPHSEPGEPILQRLGAQKRGSVPVSSRMARVSASQDSPRQTHGRDGAAASPRVTLMRQQRAQPALERDWPLFGVLRQLETRSASEANLGEPSAVQHLRRMWPEARLDAPVDAQPLVQSALADSAALSPGEPLTPEVRRGMETFLGRELDEVRLHISPIAQSLRAEAFTTGRHVVFAPGRFYPGTPAGIALLGHELTHLGQPLAFKTESGMGAVTEDSHETAARQQEEQIRSVVQNGWPQAATSERTLRSPARVSLQRAPEPTPISMVQRAVEINDVQVEPQPGQQGNAGGPPGSGQQPGSGTPGAQPPAAAQPAPNVNALARQVYSILKDRLRAERTRHELYGR